MALELLSQNFASTPVRTYGMLCLVSRVSESSLQIAALFLLMSLFSESNDCTPVVDVLLRRASSAPTLAHAFFWACHGQTGAGQGLRSRFLLFNETLLLLLDQQSSAQLAYDHAFAVVLCNAARNDLRRTRCKELLADYRKLAQPAALPTSIHHVVTGINVEQTRTLASMAAPIYVGFTPALPNVGVPGALVALLCLWICSTLPQI
jgi:hypothetical protein